MAKKPRKKAGRKRNRHLPEELKSITLVPERGDLLPKKAYIYISVLLNPLCRTLTMADKAQLVGVSSVQLYRYEKMPFFWPEYYRVAGIKVKRNSGLVLDRITEIALDGDPGSSATIKAAEIHLRSQGLLIDKSENKNFNENINTSNLNITGKMEITNEQADEIIAKMMNTLVALTIGSPDEAARMMLELGEGSKAEEN